jgi:hypothetical protein
LACVKVHCYKDEPWVWWAPRGAKAAEGYVEGRSLSSKRGYEEIWCWRREWKRERRRRRHDNCRIRGSGRHPLDSHATLNSGSETGTATATGTGTGTGTGGNDDVIAPTL